MPRTWLVQNGTVVRELNGFGRPDSWIGDMMTKLDEIEHTRSAE
jgi:hypothetical protein